MPLPSGSDDAAYAARFIGRGTTDERVTRLATFDDADVVPHLTRVFAGGVATAGDVLGLSSRITDDSGNGLDIYVSASGAPHPPHKFIPAMLLNARGLTRERARVVDRWLAETALARRVPYEAVAAFERAPFGDRASLARAIDACCTFFDDATAESLSVESQEPQTERGEPPMGFVGVKLSLRRASGTVAASLCWLMTSDGDHTHTLSQTNAAVALLASEHGLRVDA
jgi:hypothetical protein